MSIRLRLTLWYTLLLSVTVGAFALLFYLVLARTLRDEIDQALGLRAAQVRGVVRATVEERGLTAISSEDLDSRPLDELATPGIYVELLDVSGRTLAASANLPGPLLGGGFVAFESAVQGLPVTTTVELQGGERVRVHAEPLRIGDQIVGVIKVGESLQPLERTLTWTRALLLAGFAAAAGMSLLMGQVMTQRALAPIARMTANARGIVATRDYSRRLAEPPYEDELAKLAGTFNELIAQVERSLSSQQLLLADTSHELRNPLMTVLGNLNLLRRDLPPDLRLASIEEAEGEVERMRRLVSDLLLLNQADASQAIEHKPLELDALMEEAYSRARRLADGQRVFLERNDAVVILGDRDRMWQLLLNLVENAVRYTPAGGTISLRLERHDAEGLGMPQQRAWRRRQNEPAPAQVEVRLSVSDTGIGIPAEHLPYIFDRFYRVDRQRSRSDGGTGLGLAIVKWIAEAHGGSVSVQSTVGQGTTFEVRLTALT